MDILAHPKVARRPKQYQSSCLENRLRQDNVVLMLCIKTNGTLCPRPEDMLLGANPLHQVQSHQSVDV